MSHVPTANIAAGSGARSLTSAVPAKPKNDATESTKPVPAEAVIVRVKNSPMTSVRVEMRTNVERVDGDGFDIISPGSFRLRFRPSSFWFIDL